ncbi:MAG: hypothetical protein KAY24_15590, partial [Candidatus Eisenbacteria sp.]|nr:hypothetical protein [Candidatus Eisenbacteria bacterium]
MRSLLKRQQIRKAEGREHSDPRNAHPGESGSKEDEKMKALLGTLALLTVACAGAHAATDVAPTPATPGSADGSFPIVYEIDLDLATGGDQHCVGVGFDGQHFWVSAGDGTTGQCTFYIIDECGHLITSVPQGAGATGWGHRDLTYDGTHMFGSHCVLVDGYDNNYAYAGSFTGCLNVNRALAHDGTHFYTCGFGENLVRMTWDGVWGSSAICENLGPAIAGAYGLAYDKYANCLWITTADYSGDLYQYSLDGTLINTYTTLPEYEIHGGCTMAETRFGYVLVVLMQSTPDKLVFYQVHPWTIKDHVINQALIDFVAGQVMLTGSMSNFDVHQGCFDEADNFEVDFYGDVDADDLLDWYHGWGCDPRFDEIRIEYQDHGAEAMWLNRSSPVPYCEWVHFGVETNPDLSPMDVQAWWTKVIKHEQIPVPFQWWLLGGVGVIDWLTLSPTFDYPVIIYRDWAVSPEILMLEELQYDSTPVLWNPFDEILLNPGEINTDLVIPLEPGMQGYLVRYAVAPIWDPNEIITRFVAQAGIPYGSSVIEIVMVNFDVHQNNPGMAYDNLELDLFGNWLDPSMIWQIYELELLPTQIPAWGVPALTRRFPPGMFPQMPDRGGIEITWVDKFDPFRFCETFHFGATFSPEVIWPLPFEWPWVQAYWTTIEKEPVPIPWQTWEAMPGGVRDVITYGGEQPWPVWIDREWVVLDAGIAGIPLDDLTWCQVEPLPWQPVPGDPVMMQPGDMI